jgi:hypothetical protein
MGAVRPVRPDKGAQPGPRHRRPRHRGHHRETGRCSGRCGSAAGQRRGRDKGVDTHLVEVPNADHLGVLVAPAATDAIVAATDATATS